MIETSRAFFGGPPLAGSHLPDTKRRRTKDTERKSDRGERPAGSNRPKKQSDEDEERKAAEE